MWYRSHPPSMINRGEAPCAKRSSQARRHTRLIVVGQQRPAAPPTDDPSRRAAIPAARRRSSPARSAALTVGAGSIGVPAWFGGAEKTKPWKRQRPVQRQGYEAAVAYAFASRPRFSEGAGQRDGDPFNNLTAQARSRSTSTSRSLCKPASGAKAVGFSRRLHVNSRSLGRKASRSLGGSINGLKKYTAGCQVGRRANPPSANLIKTYFSPKVSTRTTPQYRRSRTASSRGVSSSTYRHAFYVTAVQVRRQGIGS